MDVGVDIEVVYDGVSGDGSSSGGDGGGGVDGVGLAAQFLSIHRDHKTANQKVQIVKENQKHWTLNCTFLRIVSII